MNFKIWSEVTFYLSFNIRGTFCIQAKLTRHNETTVTVDTVYARSTIVTVDASQRAHKPLKKKKQVRLYRDHYILFSEDRESVIFCLNHRSAMYGNICFIIKTFVPGPS